MRDMDAHDRHVPGEEEEGGRERERKKRHAPTHPPTPHPLLSPSFLSISIPFHHQWPASTFNASDLPDPVPGGRYITPAPGTDQGGSAPIPAAADLFNAGAAARMPVPFAAARRRRAIAAGVGSAAAACVLAGAAFTGVACTRAWRRSRDAAERAGCERGLAIGMSNATGGSSGPGAGHGEGGGGGGGAGFDGWSGGKGLLGGGGPGGPASGNGVPLSGALAALAAARGAEGPASSAEEEGGFKTGDTLAAALSTHGGRPPQPPSSSGAATVLPASGSAAPPSAASAPATDAAATARDAPAPDDWSACLAAQLGPSGWALDGAAVRILTAPDGRPRRLGEGGFGAVYLAEMDGSTQVAVKILSTQQPREGGRLRGSDGRGERERKGREGGEGEAPTKPVSFPPLLTAASAPSRSLPSHFQSAASSGRPPS